VKYHWLTVSLICAMVMVAWRGGAGAVKRPALQRLADSFHISVARALSSETFDDPILALRIEADSSILGREARLVQEIERLLVFRLENGSEVARVLSVNGDLESVKRQGASLLLRGVLGVEGGNVTLTAELTPLHVPFWARLIDSKPRGAKHHLFASEKADDEIILLLGRAMAPPALGSWHLEEILSLPGQVIDLGLGDLDGDSQDELVLLLPDAIEVFSLGEHGPKHITRHGLSHLPEALVRSRDPAGNLLVKDFNRDGRAEVFFRLFNKRQGQILAWVGSGFRELRRLDAVPLCQFSQGKRPMLLFGWPEPGTNRYQNKVQVVDINNPKGPMRSAPSSFSALRCWQGSEGGKHLALLVGRHGDLFVLERDFSSRKVLEGVGVGMVAVDLDMDKSPEWVLSDAVSPGEADSIRVMSRGQVIWRSRDVIGGIVAVAGAVRSSTGKPLALIAAVDPNSNTSRIYFLGR